jgi:CheY-like chemotaxis protein
MQIVTDGREAIDYFSGEGKFHDRELFPLPAITFLDLKLPYLSGFQVLRWIREHPIFRELVVVVLTSSDEERDVRRATALGVHTYMVKPPTPDRLKALLLPASEAKLAAPNCTV